MVKTELQHYDLVYNFNNKLEIPEPNNPCNFRMNNNNKTYVKDLIKNTKDFLQKHCLIASFQYEIGEKTFNHHLQMRIKLRKGKTNSMKDDMGIKKFINDSPLKGANITPTSKNCIDNNDWFYPAKDDTKVDNHYLLKSNNWTITDIKGVSKKEKIIDFCPEKFSLDRITLHNQQEEIIKIAKEEVAIKTKLWNDRSINYIFDPYGDSEKSTLCGVLKFNDMGLNIIKLPCINDYKILCQDLYQQASSIGERDNFMICIDFPRSLNKDKLYSLYSAIEESKEGCFYDPRYDRKEWAINCPSIWIFANTPPELNVMTLNRWKFWTITDKKLVKLDLSSMRMLNLKYHHEQFVKKQKDHNDRIKEIEDTIILYNIKDQDQINNLCKVNNINKGIFKDFHKIKELNETKI